MDSKQRIDSTSRHHGHHKHHRHHCHGRNKKPLVIGIIVAAVAVALGSASVVNQLNRRKNYHVTGTIQLTWVPDIVILSTTVKNISIITV